MPKGILLRRQRVRESGHHVHDEERHLMDVARREHGKKHLRKDRRADFIHRLTLNGAALGAGISNAGSLRGKLGTEGYDGLRTQIGFGMQSNWIGESAGEIGRKLKRHKPQSPSTHHDVLAVWAGVEDL